MSEDRPPPDFAMLRAVEVLADIANRRRGQAIVPPAPIDRPVLLVNERQTFALARTRRPEVERTLGTGFPYPARGWHTYAVAASAGRRLLSVIYRDDALTGVEYYVPKSKTAPALAARDVGEFRLVPGDVTLGAPLAALDARYTPAAGGPARVIYSDAYEIRFPGGLGYVMGNDGIAERLVLYAAA